MKQIRPTQNKRGIKVAIRRGSTLLVVIALLAMLSLLGVVFYTFSNQERSSAEYFAESAVNVDDIGLNPDVYYDWALEQLIVGPPEGARLYNSALWSRRHSMIPNMFGIDHANDKISDAHPYSGEGVNLILDASDVAAVDQDYNGTPDNAFLLDNNFSPAAQGVVISNWSGYPEIDVNYTSPDINNMFLAYKAYVPGPNWPTIPGNIKQVIIPSFHRPQYLRTSAAPATDWYVNSAYGKRVFRPHPDHVFVDKSGTPSATPRFDPAQFPGIPLDGLGATSDGKMGIWTGSGETEYFLDVDNDGDGIREGIWMDLDFPPVENASVPGTYVIPLFSFTVYDLDGLIGLNTAGNMRQPGGATPTPNQIDLNYAGSGGTFGNNETATSGTNRYLFLSRSNLGLSSPGEINPQWALYAQPPLTSPLDAVEQHRNFFGSYPLSWPELSNMEYFFLKFGRPIFSSGLATGTTATQGDITDLAAGIWGETSRLYNSQRVNAGSSIFVGNFPRPGAAMLDGTTEKDDNNDRFEGTYRDGTLQLFNGNLGSNVHSNGSPLSFNGAGRRNKVGSGSGDYRQPDLRNGGFGGPGVWPFYTDLEIAATISNPVVRWPNTLFSTSSIASASILTNDADEIIVDRDNLDSVNDTILGPDELAFLHLSGSDITNAGVTSRLETLLPHNFGGSSKAQEIRKNFTTISWDRKQFGKSIIPGFRDWERSSGFPPPFPGVNDPFRPELRDLLELSAPVAGIVQGLFQQKLNINKVLVYEGAGVSQTLSFRQLTPHPGEDYDGNGMLGTNEDLNGNTVLDILPATAIDSSWDSGSLPAYPPTNVEQQEFWARYDRQRMARDIYVLLYVLGGGDNSLNYTGDNSANALYTDDEMQQMAQFAVNMVDALDRDDVLTRFEYDTNLGNGWNLDDNPYTDDGVTDRAEVWGVEEQKLTLSEFLAIKANKVEDMGTDTNHEATEYDDTKDRYFSYIELRNASPNEISLANDAWQIRLELVNRETPPTVSFSDSHHRRLTLRTGNVSPGGLFTIRSAGDADNVDPMTSMVRDSFFRVDPNFTMVPASFFTVAPQSASLPTAEVDLITDSATSDFFLTNESVTSTALTNLGDFLNDSNAIIDADDIELVVTLHRRAHLGRSAPGFSNSALNNDNPWVEVDRMVIPDGQALREFSLTPGDNMMTIPGKLANLNSYSRSQPLYARGQGEQTANIANRVNTIGGNNIDPLTSSPLTAFRTWQPHFDRDFASPAELLSIPLCGPDKVTEQLVTQTGNYGYQARNSTASTNPQTGAIDDDDVNVAGIQKFLDPDGPNNSANINDDNRWYRLFEYVEVPTRLHRHLANPLQVPRVAGKLNLNTIRHPSVLAALIDDMGTVADTTSNALNIDNYSADVQNTASHHPRMTDRVEFGRDWWEQYLLSRDSMVSNSSGGIEMLGIDGAGNLTRSGTQIGFTVPGLPGTRPFKSLDTLATNGQVRDLRETGILRSLPLDLQNPIRINNPRGLFEVASWDEHSAAGSSAAGVDYFTRNRILSKIMGNTTTRSNTFIVFVSVAFFDATGPGLTVDNGVVQIGARANGGAVNSPDFRGFFVIDRSRANDAFNSTSEKFENWKRLIRYRRNIQ